jgi:hypothetical protein
MVGKGYGMHVVIMQARVQLKSGDRVRYNPPFADPHAGKLATVEGFADDEKDPTTPYWIQITYDIDVGEERKEDNFIAIRYAILEGQRLTEPRDS